MTDSDEAIEALLVTRSQAGDRPAFEQLVRRTARVLFARLYLQTGSAHAAEDLAQETFLIAWRSVRQVTDPRGFRTWLLSIAHTVAIDAGRRESRKKRSGNRMSAAVLETIPDRAESPPQILEREESRQQVLGWLRELPEDYRLPLMLRYLHGSDYASISRELGLSNGSLRGLLNRGMTMLREKAAVTGMTWNAP